MPILVWRLILDGGWGGPQKVFPAQRRDGGDGKPIGKGCSTYPENMKFGVGVSTGPVEKKD